MMSWTLRRRHQCTQNRKGKGWNVTRTVGRVIVTALGALLEGSAARPYGYQGFIQGQADCLAVQARKGDFCSHRSHIAGSNLPVWRRLHRWQGALEGGVLASAARHTTQSMDLDCYMQRVQYPHGCKARWDGVAALTS